MLCPNQSFEHSTSKFSFFPNRNIPTEQTHISSIVAAQIASAALHVPFTLQAMIRPAPEIRESSAIISGQPRLLRSIWSRCLCSQ